MLKLVHTAVFTGTHEGCNSMAIIFPINDQRRI